MKLRKSANRLGKEKFPLVHVCRNRLARRLMRWDSEGSVRVLKEEVESNVFVFTSIW